MKKYWHQFLALFLKHWPLAGLFFLCGVLWVLNLKPEVSIMGWDNFSVSSNLSLNFSRTIFATWREYRGLGVPSDSEVVDVFRQLFQLVLDGFLPASMVEGVYYLAMLTLGCISSYLLVTQLLLTVNKKTKPTPEISIASLIAATYYVFNLHTFEVFFFPIAMYVTRYGFFPLMLYAFLRVLNQPKFKLSNLLLLMASVLLGSVSYLTATVFFTFLILLAALVPSYLSKIPKLLAVGGFFILLNLFWLLPFSNYYVQKAELIPTASSFIEVNEALLNKPSSYFSWYRIFSFYPDFFDQHTLPFRNQDGTPYSVTTLATNFNGQPNYIRGLIFAPLTLVLVGLVALILRLKHNAKAFWVAVLALGMWFLLRKEQAPLGFLYDFLGNQIPLFKIVFRFGSAKFSPLLLIANTLLLGLGLQTILSLSSQKLLLQRPKLKRYMQVVIAVLCISILVWPFRQTYNGELFSRIVQNQVPNAYEEVLSVTEANLDHSRILHVPYDEFSYWKSYSWGYVGSSFLSFMTHHPVLDRTFEPASPELDNYLSTFQTLSSDFEQRSPAEQQRRATMAFNLLKSTQTRYILFDESVGTDVTSRGLQGWGVFNERDYQFLVAQMQQLGYISPVKTAQIDGGSQRLVLYEVKDTSPIISTWTNAVNIDPKISNTFIDPLFNSNLPFIQTTTLAARTYPFWQPLAVLSHNDSNVSLELPYPHTGRLTTQVASPSAGRKVPYSIYLNLADDNLQVTLVQELLPFELEVPNQNTATANLKLPANFTTQKETIDAASVADNYPYQGELLAHFKLLINGNVIPIPANLSSTQQYHSSLLLDTFSPQVSLLSSQYSLGLTSQNFALTQDPNCYKDKMPGYTYDFNNQGTEVKVTTTNGMTCVTAPLLSPADSTIPTPAYFEASISFDGGTQETHTLKTVSGNSADQELTQSLQLLPSYGSISACLINLDTGECLNKNEELTLKPNQTVVIPGYGSSAQPQSQLLIAVQAGDQQSSNFKLTATSYRIFSISDTTTLVLTPNQAPVLNMNLPESQTLALSWKPLLSAGTNLSGSQVAVNTYQGNCVNEGQRKVMFTDTIPLLSYVDNCFQGVFKNLILPQETFQIWSADYNVFKGKQPRFVLSTDRQLSNQFVSRYDVYPNIPGSKSLQVADQGWWASSQYYQSQIKTALNQAQFQTAYTIVPDQKLSITNLTNAQYEINQQSEGQSLIGIDEFKVQELPAEWRNLSIDNGQVAQEFDSAEVVATETLLPSLWKVTLKQPTTINHRKILLTFGQAFDTQWQLFKTNSPVGAFFNLGKVPVAHVKVQGWSNGWIIPTETLDQEQVTFYLLYVPERLAVVGWIATGFTAFGVVSWLLYRKLQRRLRV